MKYVLVVAVEPSTDGAYKKPQQWTDFLREAEEILESSPHDSMPNEGTVLLRIDESLATLSILINLALHQGIETRALFFEEDPQWVVTKP